MSSINLSPKLENVSRSFHIQIIKEKATEEERLMDENVSLHIERVSLFPGTINGRSLILTYNPNSKQQ